MKIAILTCLNSNDVCTRAGCLQAFFQRKDFFQNYGEDVELTALMTCNGCKKERSMEPEEDAGMQEKIQRLKDENVEVVHVGVCRNTQDKTECPRMTRITHMLEKEGIRIVRGTHRE